MDAIGAALETGRLRLRPVLLTAFTTVSGLMPMVLTPCLLVLGDRVSRKLLALPVRTAFVFPVK